MLPIVSSRAFKIAPFIYDQNFLKKNKNKIYGIYLENAFNFDKYYNNNNLTNIIKELKPSNKI